jgi:hypothetical protein
LDGTLDALQAKFGTSQWVDGWHSVLKPMDVQPAMAEVNLLPA